MKPASFTPYNFNDPELVSGIDDLNLWAAPFGLQLLETVQYKKNTRVLDIGCGMGFPLIELAMRLGPSCTAYGIDPWPAGLHRAQQKTSVAGVNHITWVEGVAEALPFEDAYFNLLVSNNGMNNVQHLPAAFSECYRVAQPGAQFVFTMNTEDTFIEFYTLYRTALARHRLERYEQNIAEHIYARRKPLPEIDELLLATGFQKRNMQQGAFTYRFASGAALFQHFASRYAFLEAWLNIIPEEHREPVFDTLEQLINREVTEKGCFTITVPFVTIDCIKPG
ncbi:MAG: methyltransferase domain-containing protein [Dinghuibacter sp.]|nr:methyltransferase domain-containing protein [Dinghuibacter sp.]